MAKISTVKEYDDMIKRRDTYFDNVPGSEMVPQIVKDLVLSIHPEFMSSRMGSNEKAMVEARLHAIKNMCEKGIDLIENRPKPKPTKRQTRMRSWRAE